MKKKICIVTSSFPKNKNDARNAGVFVKDFATLLSKEDFDVFILSPFKKDSINDFESINVHFFPWLKGEFELSSLNPKNPLHFIKLVSVVLSGLFVTTNFIRKNKIDYCLGMWAVPSGIFTLFAKFLFNTPYFVWVLGSDIWRIQDYPMGKYILKKILKNSNKLYADGLRLAQDVEILSNKKCDFLASSRILNTIKKQLDYKKFVTTKKNFMFLGRYHTNKGVDLLIEAVNLLSFEDRKKSAFHIFGGGPLEKKIKEMVNDFGLNDCIFINDYLKADEVFSYMSKSDFIVIPSRIEGIPVALSDCLQSKKPLVLTNVGDMGRLASQYNIGFVQEPNSKSISDGLRQAIKSDQKQREGFLSGMNELMSYLDLKKSVKTFIKSIN